MKEVWLWHVSCCCQALRLCSEVSWSPSPPLGTLQCVSGISEERVELRIHCLGHSASNVMSNIIMCLANDQIGRGEHEGKDNVVGVSYVSG